MEVRVSDPTRDDIVRQALRWLNTPYHHQACLLGVGVDCLGLIRGVYQALYDKPLEDPPAYSASWGETDDSELLLKAARYYLVSVSYPRWKRGDVLIFRVRHAKSSKHCAIALDDGRMIHAISSRGVLITGIGEWEKQISGVFSFPGVK